jgi:predicted ester cyclase
MSNTKEIVIKQLFNEMWNKQNVSLADDIFLSTCKFNLPDGSVVSLKEFKTIIQQFFQAFPKIQHYIDDQFGSAHKFAVRWHGGGKNEGPLGDSPATGRDFNYAGISIFYFDLDQKITEVWIFNNFSDALNQLHSA